MAEWYRVGFDYDELAEETADIVAQVARVVTGGTELARPDGRRLDLSPPWERMSVDEAFERYAGIEQLHAGKGEAAGQEDAGRLAAEARCAGVRVPDDATWEETFFRVFVERVEPNLGVGRPTVLMDWPPPLAALARIRRKQRGWRAERFEVFCGGLELANAFGELTDADEQRRRLVEDQEIRGKKGRPAHELDERFLSALEEGVPPCSGIALGFDRLVMLLAGASRIRDVIAFASEEL